MKDIRLETASLLGEIQTLAYMVNEFTDYCVFTRFFGHVNKMDVEIASSKKRYSERMTTDSLYLPSPDKDEVSNICALKQLQKVKSELKKILRKQNIDYSRLNYEVEEVRHYKLT